MRGEVLSAGSVPPIRYAQCWEDADILLKALDVRPGHTCLSIGSAGDNTLALLSRGPERVIAVDLNPAQIACLELRVAAYRELSHRELLELVGSRRSEQRAELYRRCRPLLSVSSRNFWDCHTAAIHGGIGASGRFERYLALFRSRVLPLIHTRARVERLLRGGSARERQEFYQRQWNTRRWRCLSRIFLSRFVMARTGRDPGFFRYAAGSVSGHLLRKIRCVLTELDPLDNPYLQWILTGRHATALPYALRPENFDAIRCNLDRLEWHCSPIDQVLASMGHGEIDRYNLSDVFEYMSREDYRRHLELLVRCGRRGGRLAYWNMLVDRRRPECLADRLRPLSSLAAKLEREDKAFFYSAFLLEEIV